MIIIQPDILIISLPMSPITDSPY